MKKILLIALILVCGKIAYAQQTGDFYLQVPNNGIASNIYFHVPTDYDSTKTYPLLWAWHGAGMPGGNMLGLMLLLQDSIKGIVVCPDANNATTNDQLNFLINYSYAYPKSFYKIDTAKIVVTGYSWGGNMSYQIGLLNPNIVKGIIGIAPAIGSAQFAQQMWDNITKIRMATILGSLDFNYTPVSSLMTEIKSRGGSLLYIEKEGLDHQGSNGYFNRQEFIDDYMKCYRYVLNNTSGAEIKDKDITEIEITISPNPATDIAILDIALDKSSTIKVDMFDLFGRLVLTESHINCSAGSNKIKLDLMSIPTGVYYYSVTTDNAKSGGKLNIVK